MSSNKTAGLKLYEPKPVNSFSDYLSIAKEVEVREQRLKLNGRLIEFRRNWCALARRRAEIERMPKAQQKPLLNELKQLLNDIKEVEALGNEVKTKLNALPEVLPQLRELKKENAILEIGESLVELATLAGFYNTAKDKVASPNMIGKASEFIYDNFKSLSIGRIKRAFNDFLKGEVVYGDLTLSQLSNHLNKILKQQQNEVAEYNYKMHANEKEAFREKTFFGFTKK